MSMLENDMSFQDPESKRVAKDLIFTTRRTYQSMVHAFNQGSRTFWGASPEVQQAALDFMGTNAAEVFQLHGKLGALIAEINPDDIQEGLSIVGAFTYNEDGTVTLN